MAMLLHCRVLHLSEHSYSHTSTVGCAELSVTSLVRFEQQWHSQKHIECHDSNRADSQVSPSAKLMAWI
jgi:hypothetical protein